MDLPPTTPRSSKKQKRAVRPVSVGGAVARFAIGSLAAIAVVVVGGFFALRSVAIEDAQNETEIRVRQLAQLVEAELDEGVLRADPDALEELDSLVLTRVLSSSVVRVKLWSTDGRIVYSDEPALVGRAFGLSDDHKKLLEVGGAAVELSSLDRPENEFDRGEGDLLEAYTTIRSPSGSQIVFEIYERFDSATSSAENLLRALAPTLLAGLAVIALAQAPLAWSMARRLQRGHRERERLLAQAVEASDIERRRIAAHLHDGAVQDVAGVAFALSPIADRAAATGDKDGARALRDAAGHLRNSVRDMRSLLVDLHPVNLQAAGIEAAISDLVSPLRASGVAIDVDVADDLDVTPDQEALLYRVAQEAVRNVASHAEATSLRVVLTTSDGMATLTVNDDGRGFDGSDRERRREEGHLGLSLVEELVAQSGGHLSVRSAPGEGTRIEAEVPRP